MLKFAQILQDCSEAQGEVVKTHKKDFVKIRKENRQKIFNKRRKIQEQKYQQQDYVSQELVDSSIKNGYGSLPLKKFYEKTYVISDLENLFKLIKEDDLELIFQGIIGIRKILSNEKKPPIQEVLNQGLLDLFLNLLQNHPNSHLRTQSAWAIANLCSGTSIQCAQIIQKNTLQIVIDLLDETQIKLIEQLIWIVGNMACDSIVHRNLVINLGAVPKMIKIINNHPTSKQIIKHTCWALSNICRGNPMPKFQIVKEAIEKLAYVVAGDQISDEQTFVEICWAISNYVDSRTKRTYFIVENNLVFKVIPILLDKDSREILVPCIRIVGGLTTGSYKDVDQLFKTNVMETIHKLLVHKNKTVRREIAWVLSNIAASKLQHVQHILSNEQLLKTMINILQDDTEQIRKQILFTFSNMCHSCKQLDLDHYYFQIGLIEYYQDLLTSKFKFIIRETLQSLNQVLKFSETRKKKRQEKNNFFAVKLRQQGVADQIQSLQSHDCEQIYSLVTQILTNYYMLEDPLALSSDQRKNELQKLSFTNTQLFLKDKVV